MSRPLRFVRFVVISSLVAWGVAALGAWGLHRAEPGLSYAGQWGAACLFTGVSFLGLAIVTGPLAPSVGTSGVGSFRFRRWSGRTLGGDPFEPTSLNRSWTSVAFVLAALSTIVPGAVLFDRA